jgi:phage shock protein PspC (stress-responsive transcriptional regulator)
MFTPAVSHKKLMRSRRDKKIAGVCAGFAEYLDLDATLVRLVWLMLVFFGGWGLIGYVVAWIIMPGEPETPPAAAIAPSTAPQPAPNP